MVEGINRVYKHVKPNRRNPQGGRLSKEMPIAVSNVLLFCPHCRRGVRIGRRYAADGRKERFCKKCGAGLGVSEQARDRSTRRNRKPHPSKRRDSIGRDSPIARLRSCHGPVAGTLSERNRAAAGARSSGGRTSSSLPRLQKIVVNMGVGKALQDKNRMEQAAEQLTQITGQQAQITKAKVAVSGFRLREGNEIGCRVTLRGQRMYEFLDRLISIALPRIRDFRGVNPKSFDGHGNYSLGLTRADGVPRDRSGQGDVHARHGRDLRDQHEQRRRGPRIVAAVRHAVPRGVRRSSESEFEFE